MNRRSSASLLLVAALAAAANAVAVVADDPVIVAVAGLAIGCMLPGWVAASILFGGGEGDDVVERLVFAAGIGFVCLIAGMLALHYVPGPLTPALILIGFDALLLLLLAVAARRATDLAAPGVPTAVAVQVAVLLALGAVLRLTSIGYAEFQGDEATILHKAAAAIQGRADALFVHKKGPAEILIPALQYSLAGTTTEAAARLAFAAAMLAGLAAVYQVGRSMYSPRVGFVAGLLLAVNGFFIGFGRIVQYQAIVFLTTALAVLAAYRAYRGAAPRRHLALAAVLVAVGVLAHYDAALAVPAIGYLTLVRWRGERAVVRGDVAAILLGAAMGAALLAAFYVPMVAHPYFREATLPYLLDVRVGGAAGHLHNTLARSVPLAVFYNSTYYMAFLSVTLLGGMAYHLVRTGPRAVGRVLAVGLIVGSVVLVARPDAVTLGDESAAVVFIVAYMAILLLSSSPSVEWKALLLWFGAGFLLYGTLVSAPRTHFHVIFPAWCALCAVTLDRVYAAIASPTARRAAAAGFAGLIALFAVYGWLVFVQHDVLYKRAFPERKAPGFWTFLEELPSSGWFGFPYRAGWKAVGALYADGTLQGSYWSNEEELITDWYTRGAPRCDDAPRYYFVAEGAQDERPIPADIPSLGYEQVGAVAGASGDEPTILIYERRPAQASSYRSGIPVGPPLDVDGSIRDFDRQAGTGYEPGLPYAFDLGYVERPLDVDFGGEARLVGYALHAARSEPGGEVNVDLYWRGQSPMQKDYSVFAHLVSEGDPDRVIAQSDGAPGVCGDSHPTTGWQPGRVVLDRRTVRLPDDAPAGRYVVTVGMYDYETLERLPVIEGGVGVDDRVRLADIEIGTGG